MLPMSVLGKIWKIKNRDANTPLLQKILKNRGIESAEEVERFLNPDASRDFHDPFLMNDMERAATRINTAIKTGERIMLFGDYDIDGITGCAILMRALIKLGAKVSYRLPHRIEDGYGLREKFVKEFKTLDVKLAITVDNGISCTDEVELARGLGIDTIITDHHAIPKKLPKAYAILHPKLADSNYPFADLTGAGVALKLAQALYIKHLKNPEKETKKLLDLACMGTIGDLGPLRGENRYIVKEGLKVLEHTRWPGLSRLKQFAGVHGKVSAHAIGFFLGPRINAAGRISHPSHALQLLLQSEKYTAASAAKLEGFNQKRQKLTDSLMEIAETLAKRQLKDSIIIISHPEFHGGIIGLLAGKLSEKYSRPAIVMEDRGEILIGSCRSIPEINIIEALDIVRDMLGHYGGHAAAAGFDLKKKSLPDFMRKIKNHVAALLKNEKLKPTLYADCEIPHKEVSQENARIVQQLEPFGIENAVPRFVCKALPVHGWSVLGNAKNHLKIQTTLAGTPVDCIGFKLGEFAGALRGASTIDVVCELEENVWNGTQRLQLKILDFKIA